MNTITMDRKTVQAILNALATVEVRGSSNLNALLACIQALEKALNAAKEVENA